MMQKLINYHVASQNGHDIIAEQVLTEVSNCLYMPKMNIYY